VSRKDERPSEREREEALGREIEDAEREEELEERSYNPGESRLRAVLLLASNALQNAMIGNDNSVTGGVVGAAALFAANYGFVRLTYSNRMARRLLEGTPLILLEDGRLIPAAMRREAISETELLGAALDRGFASLAEVGLIALETNGHLAVLDEDAAKQWRRGQMLGRR